MTEIAKSFILVEFVGLFFIFAGRNLLGAPSIKDQKFRFRLGFSILLIPTFSVIFFPACSVYWYFFGGVPNVHPLVLVISMLLTLPASALLIPSQD